MREGIVMPPHCDAMDGPVVTAALAALESGQVETVLPYVPEDGEREIRGVFEDVLAVRRLGTEARSVADRLFFETVVRIHRRGEGATFTGLKPAGLDVGPAIPAAERAIETGNADELADLLGNLVRDRVKVRLDEVLALREQAGGAVSGRRRYVSSMLGFQVWSHRLYGTIEAASDEHREPGG